MEFWIPLLGSALGGALVAGVFQIVKSVQEKRTEHAQWLRDQKREENVAILNSFNESRSAFATVMNPRRPKDQEIHVPERHKPVSALILLAPKKVRAALEVVMTDFSALERAAQSDLKDLASNPRHDFPWPQGRPALAAAEESLNGLFRAMREDLGIQVLSRR